MQATELMRYKRTAPRKLRVVAKLMVGKSVGEAISALLFCPKAAAVTLRKVLLSAIANAEDKSKGSVETDSLVVRSVTIDGGPKLKRWRARAMGRASRIEKATSHIRIVLDDEG